MRWICRLGVWGVCAGAWGQGTPTLQVGSRLVVVPAVVRDAKGGVVYGLGGEDFVVTDDGVRQVVKVEEDAGSSPLALMVVVEAGASAEAAGWHPNLKGKAGDRFATLPGMVEAMTAGVTREVGVVGFDSRPEVLQGLTGDMGKVAGVLREFTRVDEDATVGDGGAAIVDAVGMAVEVLRRAPAGYRRAILLVSETRDRGSVMAMETAVRGIGETNTAVYSVAFSTGYQEVSKYGAKVLPTKRVPPKGKVGAPPPIVQPGSAAEAVLAALSGGIMFENPEPYGEGGCMKGKVSNGYDCMAGLAPPLALAKMGLMAATAAMRVNTPKEMARMTGGEYFQFSDVKGLESGLAEVGNGLPNRYVLTFQARAGGHVGLHKLQVTVPERVGVSVVGRESYWVDEER